MAIVQSAINANNVYTMALHTMVGQYDDIECMLGTYILHNAPKHGYDDHYAVKKIEIHLKT